MALTVAVLAQDVPLQRPEERMVTRKQSESVYDAIRPVARQASGSTVWVWANRKQVAMGTVVGDGSQILTKWSEIAFSRVPVQVVGGDGRTATATVLGIYQEEDLALLQLDGARFTPIKWSEEPTPSVGRFLVASGPDDNPLSVGVVAVAERTLRESDQAFIGISLDPAFEGEGVRVREVDERGGADEAGVQPGDVLIAINGEGVASAFELRNALLEFSPGDTIKASISRDGQALEIDINLGGRPEFQGVPEGRLRTMRQMGGPLSLVSNNFPVVIQTDMQLKPQQCGGPVLDLDGRAIGLSISRTDRTRSFIIPASRVMEVLGKKPVDPALATLPQQAGPQARQRVVRPQQAPRPRAVPMNPGSVDRLRRHLEEMGELLERLDREVEELRE
ncbi:S1C family serine protease [Haloferula rosea]|uniref:PDZ domain-containing protein n=1 Tax=Haloferula rosea TaxID=490093 RepID=A0A934VDB6_9BACT|nr:PDZ domain-containing protein [Haloferula rosea]MBK1826114.1 PDZ domain-containing protein [Haloferula rosea]